MQGAPVRIMSAMVVAVVIVTPGAQRMAAQSAAVIADPDAYAVYRAVVPKVTSTGQPINRIALLDETRFEDCLKEVDLPSEWLSVVRDFRTQNAATRTYVPAMLDLGVPVELVPLDRVTALLKAVGFDAPGVTRGGWDDAYTGFPEGTLLTLSAVGFNPDRSLAMITVAERCGLSGERRSSARGDCHQFKTFVMQKTQDRWVSSRTPGGFGCIGMV